jgi:hypothetical protein
MTFVLRMHEGAVSVRHGGELIEVRGKPRYEVDHDPHDPLHQFLDSLDPATVSHLFAAEDVPLNPNNPRTGPSILACRALFSLPSPLELLLKGLLE